jgi:hypothetical protein
LVTSRNRSQISFIAASSLGGCPRARTDRRIELLSLSMALIGLTVRRTSGG